MHTARVFTVNPSRCLPKYREHNPACFKFVTVDSCEKKTITDCINSLHDPVATSVVLRTMPLASENQGGLFQYQPAEDTNFSLSPNSSNKQVSLYDGADDVVSITVIIYLLSHSTII